MISISFVSFAKKDFDAWKSEKSLSKQYEVFKKNLKYWNGSYFMNEQQMEEYYGAITDSIGVIKKEISDLASRNKNLQNELNSTFAKLEEKQLELDKSIKNQNSLVVFGQYISKGSFTFIAAIIILGLGFLAGILFLMFKRSNKVAVHLKNEYNELKEEFEIHKKNALERYTKMNLELQHTRLKLNKKLTFGEKV